MSKGTSMIRWAVRRSLLAASLAGAAVAVAHGQEAPAADTGPQAELVEVVTVTGSRIRQANLVSVSPVAQIDASQFEQRGAVRIEDVLNRMPQVIGAQGNNSSLRGISGTAQVDLRGLGATRTLVLVDGQRMPYGSPKTPAADLNLIPTQLIKNVEVLTGGASAVYGSDAIAGVVNISLIDDFEGLRFGTNVGMFNHENDNGKIQSQLRKWEVSNPGQYTLPDDDDWGGFAQEYTVMFGHNFDSIDGNVTLYATARETDEVKAWDRDFALCKVGPINGGSAYDCVPSPVSNPASFVASGPGAAGLPSQFRMSEGQFLTRDPLVDSFNSQPYGQFQRPEQRYTFGALAHAEINEHFKPFMQLNMARTHTYSDYAPGAVQTGRADATGTIACDNPFLSAQEQAFLCTNRGLATGSNYDPVTGAYLGPVNVATGIALNRITPELGGRHDDYRLGTIRMLFGSRGDVFGPFKYEASLSYANTTMDRFITGLPSQIRAVTALNSTIDRRIKADGSPLANTFGQPVCVINADGTTLNDDPKCSPLDFYSAAGPSQAGFDYVYAKMVSNGSTSQTDVLGTINGDLAEYGLVSPLASDGVAIAFGAEVRKNTLRVEADSEFQAQQEDFPVSGSSTVREVFGEVNVPLVQGKPGFELLSFEGAYRSSDYKDNVTTDTYKLGLNWAPIRDVRLRGSYQQAIRAPNIIELYSARLRQITLQLPRNPNGFFDPCAGPNPAATAAQCANTGVTPAQYGTIPDFNFFPQVIGGNPDLKPETAKTYSFGGVFTPSFLPELSLSIDYYNIKVEDLISTIAPTLSLSTCLNTGDPLFCGLIHRDAGGTLFSTNDAYILRTNVNTGSLLATGVDVSANYRFSPELNFSFSGSYTDKFETTPLPNSTSKDIYDCAGYYGFNCGGPRPDWRHNLTASWETPWGFGLAATWRYIAAVDISRSSNEPALKGTYAAIDKQLGARSFIDMSGSYSWRDQVFVRLGINNVLDKEPPISSVVDSISGGNGNTYPQFYDVLGRYVFGNITVQF